MALKMKRAGSVNEPSEIIASGEQVEVGGKTFTVKRNVTAPVWKWEENETKCFTILEKIHTSERLSATQDVTKLKAGERIMPPPEIAKVKDLISNSVMTLIFGSGLYRDLSENYPDDSYVGCSFRVTKLKQRKTKKGYNFAPYQVEEISAE